FHGEERGFQVPVCVTILVVFAIGTVLRNEVCRDPIRFWSDSLGKSPHNVRAYNSLAIEYQNRRDYSDAIESAESGLKSITDANARGGLQNLVGTIYLQLHQYEQAMAIFQEASTNQDRREAGKAYNNLGVVYVNLAADLDQQRAQLGDERLAAEKR